MCVCVVVQIRAFSRWWYSSSWSRHKPLLSWALFSNCQVESPTPTSLTMTILVIYLFVIPSQTRFLHVFGLAEKVILFSSTLTHIQCDAGNITFCNFCCFRCHHHHHFSQAPLRVRSTERRHQSPEWTVLCQVDCVVHIEVAGFQILLNLSLIHISEPTRPY